MEKERELPGAKRPPSGVSRCTRREFLRRVKGFALATAAYEIVSLVPFLLAGCARQEGEKHEEAPPASRERLPEAKPQKEREVIKFQSPAKEETGASSSEEPPTSTKSAGTQPSPEQGTTPAKEAQRSGTAKPGGGSCGTCTGCVGCTTCIKACTVGDTCWIEWTALRPECPVCIHACTKCIAACTLACTGCIKACIQACTIGCTASCTTCVACTGCTQSCIRSCTTCIACTGCIKACTAACTATCTAACTGCTGVCVSSCTGCTACTGCVGCTTCTGCTGCTACTGCIGCTFGT